MTTPYYADERATLYHGDMRELISQLAEDEYAAPIDLVCTDPPYGETSLPWDRWPTGWPALAAKLSSSMWCFGSARMFLEQRDEFLDYWWLSQDIVWEKHNGSGFAADRFKRVHELAFHWYRGPWRDLHHQVPRVRVYDPDDKYERRNVKSGIDHTGAIGPHNHVPDGQRLTRSVIKTSNMHGQALHPTEKPIGILTPLIEYACPPGGLVLDPFAGSGSTAVAAVMSGRKAILIEADEKYCEIAARRLAQDVLDFGEATA